MKGQLSQETPVSAPAAAIWEAYRGIELGKLITELLGHVIGKAEVEEGDGGVGTIIKLTYPAGTPGVGFIKEIFTKMDDETRVKETEIIEGEFKSLGFDSFRIKLEVIEKDGESSIIRSSIEYEILDDTKNEIVSYVSTKRLELIAETIGKYVADKN